MTPLYCEQDLGHGRPSRAYCPDPDCCRAARRCAIAPSTAVRSDMKKTITLVAGVLVAVSAASVAGIAIGASTRAGPSVANLALINGVIEIVQRDYVHSIGSDELTTDALK